MGQVPAATRAMKVLKYLASQPDPVPLESIARAVGLPRSTAYHLVTAMIEQGFVAHIADERRFCLGLAAFEVGSGYSRQAPLQRMARRPIAQLAERLGQVVHLVVPHGRDVLYVIEERAPGTAPLVTDVGVRLPAHLTASGRAILAALPAAQVRALYPDRTAFVQRHGAGPETLGALRRLLADTRARGHAEEAGEVSPGYGSIASAVLDHNGQPIAAVAVTFPDAVEPDRALFVGEVAATAGVLSRRISGQHPAATATRSPR